MSLLSDVNLTQYVSWPTHLHGHTLDLIIAPSSLDPHVEALSSTPSDHLPVLTTLNMTSPAATQTTSYPYRKIASIDTAQFISDIANSNLVLHPPSTLDDLVQCYNTTLSNLLDTHAPLITKTAKKKSKPWFTAALHSLKIACRKAERAWKQSRSTADRLTLKTTLSRYYTHPSDKRNKTTTPTSSTHASEIQRSSGKLSTISFTETRPHHFPCHHLQVPAFPHCSLHFSRTRSNKYV